MALRISDASKVAVKIIDLRTTTKDYRRRFLPREISNVASLHHPNIIRVERVGRSETKAYIIMAYAETNLRQQILKRSYIQEDLARKWFRQLTSAMDYLHRRGVAHRDLKIENILIDENDNIKLCDFGFSKVCVSNGTQTPNSSTFCGTLGYCAPEILQRTPYNPWKTDIWSLGVVLYKMVVGQMPFGEGNDLGSFRRIAKAQTQLLEFPAHPKITSNCQDLIRSLLAFDSDHRITLLDIFRSKWVISELIQKFEDQRIQDHPIAVPAMSNVVLPGTSTSRQGLLSRLASARTRKHTGDIGKDRPKSSVRPTSVISRLRMHLPSIGGRNFRRERV